MASNPVSSVIDTTTLAGGGASAVGWAATFGQYYPYITGSLAFIVMIMTIVHLHRGIKNRSLDEEIKKQQIELNNRQLRRSTDRDEFEQECG